MSLNTRERKGRVNVREGMSEAPIQDMIYNNDVQNLTGIE